MTEEFKPKVKKKLAPYYMVDVVMKTGFKYKFVCIGRNLESMLKHTNSFYWTESTKEKEITEEEYRKFYSVSLDEDQDKEKPKKKRTKKSTK